MRLSLNKILTTYILVLLGSFNAYSQEEFLRLDSVTEIKQELGLNAQYVSGSYSYFYDDSDSIDLTHSANQIIKIGNVSLVVEGAGSNHVSLSSYNRIDELSIKLDNIYLLGQDELFDNLADASYLSRKAWYTTRKLDMITKHDDFLVIHFNGQTYDAYQWKIFYRIELQYFSNE
jgi:hypothetical protein